MTEPSPISCISCRQKKIKCNKKRPCNQCERRSVVCRFPTTFRNIKIDSDNLDLLQVQARMEMSSSSGGDSSEYTLYSDDVELIKRHNQRLLDENVRLEMRSRRLAEKLTMATRARAGSDGAQGGQSGEEVGEGGRSATSSVSTIPVSGETTEAGDKYYGPQSSNYMIETLRDSSAVDEESSRQARTNSQEDDLRAPVSKRSLPWILARKKSLFQDPSLLQAHNLQSIQRLIDFFFSTNSYYTSFIVLGNVRTFVDSHDAIEEGDWENDDDLLLLNIILLIAVLRLLPTQFVDFGLLEPTAVLAVPRFKAHLTRNVLLHGFTTGRHNLLTESIVTIQAYILCCEWYFVDQKYEECWLMLFHVSAVAYLIGLHVLSHYQAGKKESSIENEKQDVAKAVVWFALRNCACQVCCILGRPNPISIQVNSFFNRSTTNTATGGMDFSAKKTQVALKAGLSECLRLLNMMLIENYMIDFSVSDLFTLARKFEEEISMLESLVATETDLTWPFSDTPTTISPSVLPRPWVAQSSMLHDLIVLNINRAKLFEPFVDKFRDHEQFYDILTILTTSIDRFLVYAVEFIGKFITSMTESLSGAASTMMDKHFGKLFRTHFPYLNSFIYQGFVVIFTFLHYKFRDFIDAPPTMAPGQQQPIDYERFLSVVEEKLKILYAFESRLLRLLSKDIKFWLSNILHLLHNNIRFIASLRERRQQRILNDQLQDLSQMMVDDDSQLDQMYYVNLSDPFWLTNPENLPYYLSSPSDDDNYGAPHGADENFKSSGSDIEQPQPVHIQPHIDGEASWQQSGAGNSAQQPLKSELGNDLHLDQYINQPFGYEASGGNPFRH